MKRIIVKIINRIMYVVFFSVLAMFLLAVSVPKASYDAPVAQQVSYEAVTAANTSVSSSTQIPLTEHRVALYFGHKGDDMLAREVRTIRQPVDQKLENLIVQELLKGPSATRTDLTRMFPQGSTLSSTVYEQREKRTLFVTLGGAVLQNSVTQNRLALYSLINTLTEAFDIDKVGLLLEEVNGARPLKSRFFSDMDDSILLYEMTREESVILTHANTFDIIMDLWVAQDYRKLYAFVEHASYGTEQQFILEMEALPGRIVSSGMRTEGTISLQGDRAVFGVREMIVNIDGLPRTLEGTISLVVEDDIWKIERSTLFRLGGKSQ